MAKSLVSPLYVSLKFLCSPQEAGGIGLLILGFFFIFALYLFLASTAIFFWSYIDFRKEASQG